MSLVDIIILVVVSLILALIIYFKIIKTKGQIGCNCSLKQSCNLKVNTLKALFDDINHLNKK